MIQRGTRLPRVLFFCVAVAACNGSSSTSSPAAPASAPASPPAAIAKLEFDAAAIIGGDSMQGIVTLTGPAARDGTAVALSSSHSSVTIPAQVVVTEGTTTAGFALRSQAVSQAVDVSIRATAGGDSRDIVLRVAAAPDLAGLDLVPSFVTGGQNATGTVRLTSAAPARAISVSLVTNLFSAAIVPSSVSVPQGSTTATFTITTTKVLFDTSAFITATLGATSRTATLSVRTGP